MLIPRVERLQAVGDWLKDNEKAIRNSQRCELIGSSLPGVVDLNLQGPWTRRGKIGYWCMFRYPGATATAVKVGTRPLRARLLATGQELQVEYNAISGKMMLKGLPDLPQNPYCTVVEVEFEDIPQLQAEPDLAAWLV